MEKRFIIENFQWERHQDQMEALFCQIYEKYPNGMYWSYDPSFCPWEDTLMLIDQTIQNENGVGKVIGKAQVKYYNKLDDMVSLDVKQRIIFHYRVLPEYEEVTEAVELLFAAIEEKAKGLAKGVTLGRKSVLCESCTDEEQFYLAHIQGKGYVERTGYYCMSLKQGEENLTDVTSAEGIEIREITMDFVANKERILEIECQCFTDDTMSAEEFDELVEEDGLIVYGAFDGAEMIGVCIGIHSEDEASEVFCLNVCESYRRKGIARQLLCTVMRDLLKNGAGEITLAVKNDNHAAINLYRATGFVEYRNERMFGKSIS